MYGSLYYSWRQTVLSRRKINCCASKALSCCRSWTSKGATTYAMKNYYLVYSKQWSHCCCDRDADRQHRKWTKLFFLSARCELTITFYREVSLGHVHQRGQRQRVEQRLFLASPLEPTNFRSENFNNKRTNRLITKKNKKFHFHFLPSNFSIQFFEFATYNCGEKAFNWILPLELVLIL